MPNLQISVVCCDHTMARHSRMLQIEFEQADIDTRLLETVEQQLGPGEARELHNAAHHPTHGPVTYLQQVHEGGFSIYVGQPQQLEEFWFGAGSWVAFMDDQGPGHASKVGPNGICRTLRVLQGHLTIPV